MTQNKIAVKIVGSEALCSAGINKLEIFKSCIEGRSAVNEQGLAAIAESVWLQISIGRPEQMSKSHCSIASSYTLKQALANAGWTEADLKDCGFIFSTTTSQIDQWQHSLPFSYMKNLSFDEVAKATRYQSLGSTLVQLQSEFKISGPSAVIASSCSASLQALNLATLWIRTGQVKKCIVGSTEILSDLTTNGFNSMRLLTKGICKPFDKNRAGINLGEASAFLCLEASDYSTRLAQGYIAGIGLATDAFHPTAPEPDGVGSLQSMRMALQDASISADQIDWFHAHGTGSTANDLAETKAISQLVMDHAENTSVSSTKSIHGHTLGACGALETVLALESLNRNLVLPTYNTTEIDPAIKLDIVTKPREKSLNVILKNSLGFGGINASTILVKSLKALS